MIRRPEPPRDIHERVEQALYRPSPATTVRRTSAGQIAVKEAR